MTNASEQFLPAELIKKKRGGGEHSPEEIRFLINNYLSGAIPDYQLAAWLMTVFFKGMTGPETSALTETMLKSGEQLSYGAGAPCVDKHSTGGVGDKTSLILAPIAAAAGLRVPMISGRGLGHTGGTLDKLESIPGFNVNLTLEQHRKQVHDIGISLIGQTKEICPADKRIYALRDVTGTVESLPLICASIMSKKLAAGLDALTLDVKFGTGAFMKTLADAERLADKLMEIAHAHGKRVSALLTSMDQPLGRFIGNSLEVGECIAILKNEKYLGREDFEDCRDLSVELAGQMIWLGGLAKTAEEGKKRAEDELRSGRAWDVFAKICKAQGGDLTKLPLAPHRFDVVAASDGFVGAFNTEAIGIAAITLGAGRAKAADTIDPVAGIEVHRKLGDSIKRGEKLFTLYASDDARFAKAKDMVLSATTISLQKPPAVALIAKRKSLGGP